MYSIDDTISAVWNHRLNHTNSQTVIIDNKMFEKSVNINFDIGCLGRCGVGCGNHNGSGYYTQDCLNHDMCAFYDIKFGWIFDRDCGDEMRKTTDDFFFGNDCYVNLNK